MPDKIDAWEKRGRRPLTIQEVQEVFRRHPFIPVPKEVIILDGVIEPGAGRGVAVGATPVRSAIMILTPLSDEGTVIHEAIHLVGVGELGAYAMTPVLMRKGRLNLGLLQRDVNFQDTGRMSEAELKARLNLVSPMICEEMEMCRQVAPEIPSGIKRYRLVNP